MSWSVKITDESFLFLIWLNTENRESEFFLGSKVHVQHADVWDFLF